MQRENRFGVETFLTSMSLTVFEVDEILIPQNK